VRDALASLPWVKNVQVDFDRKQATFTAETAKYDENAIVRVLDEAGFGGKVIKLSP
jgi:copper chaperone CopZ